MKHLISSRLISAIVGIATAGTMAPLMADGPQAYVPLGSADQVAVIATDDYRVIGEARGVVNTHGLAVTPDGGFLVAGSLTAREGEDAPSKPADVSEDEHAAHHGGGNGGAVTDTKGTLYLIDTATREVVRRFDVPGPVHHVLVTTDGRYAVSTHPMGGGISVLSLETGEVVASVATGPAPNYLTRGPEGRALYVSNSGNGTISEVDTADWFVRRNLRSGGSPEHMILDEDRGRLYVNDTAGGRAVGFDLESGNVVADYPVGPEPHGIGLSADHRTLYATSKGGNRLVAVNLRDESTRTAKLGPAPYHLAVNPADGKLLISSRELPKLWVVDPQTLTPTATVALAGEGHQIAFGVETD